MGSQYFDVPLSPEEAEILYPGAVMAFIDKQLGLEKRPGRNAEDILKSWFVDRSREGHTGGEFYVDSDKLHVILGNHTSEDFDGAGKYVWDGVEWKYHWDS